MANDVLIRPATRRDRSAMRAMWQQLALHQAAVDVRLSLAPDYLDRWEADFEPWVNSSAHELLVARDTADDSPLGFLHARLYEHAPVFDSPPEVFVEAIWVDERARGRGCGRRLVSAARDWAYRQGAHRIRYSVLVEDSVAAGFWASVGGHQLITYGTIAVDAGDERWQEEGRGQRADTPPAGTIGFAQ